jgi:phosphatidylglycerol:prolipoprotein diacylglycerol transferase
LSAILGVAISVTCLKKLGYKALQIYSLCALAIVSGILGAKITFMLGNYASGDPIHYTNMLFGDGRSFTGGLLISTISLGAFLYANNYPFLETGNAFIPGLALAQGVSKLACYMSGCCYGILTNRAWGVIFNDPLARKYAGTPLGVPLLPTQIIEAAVGFINFALIVMLYKNRRYRCRVGGLYLIVFGVERYLIEFIRAVRIQVIVDKIPVNVAQGLSILLILIGAMILIAHFRGFFDRWAGHYTILT